MALMLGTAPGIREPYSSVSFPADGAAEYIRVLKLDVGVEDVPLTGTLEVVKPDRKDSRFSALSYVWGQYRSAKHTITCNGHTLPITENCHSALLALRKLHGSLTIWVDAICIDQENIKEKEKQIPLMPDIYKTAYPVYIWLGQGNVLFDQVLKVIKTASNLEETAKKYNAMVTPSIHPYAWMWINLLRLRKQIRELKEMAETSGTSIEKLELDCEWLHRAWTMQEIMFSTYPAFVYGTNEVSWQQMTGVWYFKSSKEEKGSCASSLKFAFGGEACATQMTFLKSWGNIMSQWSYNKIVSLRPSLVNNIERNLTSYFGTQTMKNLRTRRTSNKYDHVYALHGVLKEAYEQAPPDPDYGRPLDLVYEEFIVYLFSLDSAYLNLISDSGIRQALPGAPSWLPDWSTPLEKRTWLNREYFDRANMATISHKVADESMPTLVKDIEISSAVHSRTLEVSAAFHADLVICGTLNEEYSAALFRAAIAAQSEFEIDHIPESLLSQFSALTLLYQWLRVGFCIEAFIENPQSIASTLQGVIDITSEEAKLAFRSWKMESVVQLMSDLVEGMKKSNADPHSNSTELRSLELMYETENKPGMVDFLNWFAGSMRHTRSIFITEDGASGSGPIDMILGDKIAFIAGGLLYSPDDEMGR
ncbi:hypothetical protein NW766_001781 [Fusarium irregulare]|uniref:Heterokaryon incompatibility domain-containing protein n=1 Tax=Fusarium irregulare TaxID=2494466 RepID=A0A9W8PYW0_9HYPO|nr:hypothetical protein NW766_001781 [Fusarium irregulare]